MLTSRQTWTRPEIATQIYGVLAPSEVDADGFGVVELPPDRSGLLTLSTFLLAGARSTGGSPVARGLRIHASMLCGSSPSFPAELRADPGFQQAIASLGKQSELEQAAYRAERQECAGCHQQFDAFGMVLEPYDAVGRQRSTDLEGRPIDERWTTFVLPASAGGTLVASAAELGQALATSGAFERCLAMSFINFALTDVSRGGAHNTAPSEGPPTASCAVQQVVASLAGSDHSFTSLLGEVSASDTMRLRSRGE